jgi:hypothetical protein
VEEALAEVNGESVTTRASGFWSDVLTWLPIVATVIVALLVMFGWWLRQRTRKWLKPHIVIGPFTDSGGSIKGADTLGALTAAAFHGGDEDLGVPSIPLVDAHLELADVFDGLENIDAKLAPAAGVAKFIDKLGMRTRVSVAGQLHGPHKSGAGLTLRMTKFGNVVGADTLRTGPIDNPEEPPADVFAELAEPAAGWIRHVAAEKVLGAELDDPTTAASYAWLCAGRAAQARGDTEEAVEMYDRSLQADPTHQRAIIGRALAAAEIAATSDMELLILAAALEAIEGTLDA